MERAQLSSSLMLTEFLTKQNVSLFVPEAVLPLEQGLSFCIPQLLSQIIWYEREDLKKSSFGRGKAIVSLSS